MRNINTRLLIFLSFHNLLHLLGYSAAPRKGKTCTWVHKWYGKISMKPNMLQLSLQPVGPRVCLKLQKKELCKI